MSSVPNAWDHLAIALPWAGPIVQLSGDGTFEVLAIPPPALAEPKCAFFVPVLRSGEYFIRADPNVPTCSEGRPVDATRSLESGWYVFPFDPSRFEGACEFLMVLAFDQAPTVGVALRLNALPGARPAHSVPSIGPARSTVGGLASGTPGSPSSESDSIALLSRALVRPPCAKNGIAPLSTRLVFLFGSCCYPPGILDRTPVQWGSSEQWPNTDAAGAGALTFKRVLDRMSEPDRGDRPKLLLLVGDQIYVDATAGLFDPIMASDPFRESYSAFFHAPLVQETFGMFERIEMMLDDHEIRNDWEPVRGESKNRIRRELHEATHEFTAYERFGLHADAPGRDHLDFLIQMPPAEFFVANTRTEREPRTATTFETQHIMGHDQRGRLEAWLAEDRAAPFKFVACPSMLLPRRLSVARHPDSALHEDAWDGYPTSRDWLLSYLVTEKIQNVIFLSGDEHIPSIVRIRIYPKDGSGAVVAYSIHSSAFYAPFPFANSSPNEFVLHDKFFISAGTVYVKAIFPDVGDNFVEIDAERTTPIVKVRFNGARVSKCFDIDLGEARITESH